MVGLTEDQVSGNLLDSSVVSGYVLAYAGLNTAVSIGSNSPVHVVVSRWLNKVKRVTGVTTAVDSYDVSSTVKTQRRRLT